jgi:hypothetical protein
MGQLSREQIRAIVIFGFLLNAASSVITLSNDISSPGFPWTLRGIVDNAVSPLATIVAVCAWATLTRLDVRDRTHVRILRHAYLFFAIEYLLFAIGYNFIFTPIRSFGGFWTTSGLWLEFVGTVFAALGLFLMSRSLATSAGNEPFSVE